MADDIDRAQDAAEAFRLQMLEQDRARREQAARPGVAGSAECEDCGDPIAAARRVAVPSATRCTECATRHEHWGK